MLAFDEGRLQLVACGGSVSPALLSPGQHHPDHHGSHGQGGQQDHDAQGAACPFAVSSVAFEAHAPEAVHSIALLTDVESFNGIVWRHAFSAPNANQSRAPPQFS